MIEAFLKLTPQERSAEAEKRLDETLKRMSQPCLSGCYPKNIWSA